VIWHMIASWFMDVGTYLRHMVLGTSWLHVGDVMVMPSVSC
jgi:hypothetical protein